MISVSIVSHGQNAMVNRLLKDLAVIESQAEYEIIVTENVSSDTDIEDVGGKIVRFYQNTKPQSFARNHNKALFNANGKYVCILNPDVRWVQPVFTQLSSHCDNGEVEVVAPLVIDFNGVPQDSFRNFPTPGDLIRRRIMRQGIGPLPFMQGEFVIPEWIAGIFMMMPAVVFRKLGGFDERYRMYFEDVDLCARATIAGIRIGVDTNVRIQHKGHRRSRRMGKHLFWHVLSAIRFFTSPIYRQVRSYSNEENQ